MDPVSAPPPAAPRAGWRASLVRWFDAGAADGAGDVAAARRIDWARVLPFLAIHAGCLALPWVGASAVAVGAAALLYLLRMFAVTAFYHRYFSHCAFRTTRSAQFAFALLGASAAQRGPLWWAAQHRHHHVHSDGPEDRHSALRHGFFWSHMGWFMARESFGTRRELVQRWLRFPELRFLDRCDALVPVLLALALYAAGALLARHAPALGTSGPQMLVWGFCVSTVLLYHATFAINSLAHRWGRRRYATGDASRNNLWLALLTLGEGWHNNHHHFPGSARQGFHWWQLDLTYYALRALAALGIVWDLRPVPVRLRDAPRAPRGMR